MMNVRCLWLTVFVNIRRHFTGDEGFMDFEYLGPDADGDRNEDRDRRPAAGEKAKM